MKKLIVLVLMSFASGTTFSKYSKFNKVEQCEDKSYRCIINDSLSLHYKSFGGFKFANNTAEYRKMRVKKKPFFKNVIIYGRSNVLNGDYYLIQNLKRFPNNFNYKDTLINNRKITIALSKTIDYKSNKDFLLNFNANK